MEGWRILTDPTFDPPGRGYNFGWGTGSRKLVEPALAPAELGPIDAVQPAPPPRPERDASR